MFALALAAMLAQSAPVDAHQVAFDDYKNCVEKNARAWSKGPDAARDIVAAAVARCGPEKNRAREVFVGDMPTVGVRADQQRFEMRESLFGSLLKGVEGRALALVVEMRAAR